MNTIPTPPYKRFLALIYEGLIVLAITLVATFAAIPLSYLLRQWPQLQQIMLSVWFLGAWWLYCKLNWRKGQTLAMKAWQLRLLDQHQRIPAMRQLRLRFLWAVIFLVLVPTASYLLLSHISPLPPKPRFYLSLVWWLLPWGFALLHPSKQFLYDVLAGTQVRSAAGSD